MGTESDFREEIVSEAQEFKRLGTEATALANKIWKLATPVKATHQYHRLKGIEDLQLREYHGSLIVPVFDERGKIVGLQVLTDYGSMPFQPDDGLKGNYHLMGVPDEMVYIAADFYSGTVIHKLTNNAVAIAFSDENLLPVARIIRRRFPKIDMVIAGNSDREEFDQCSMYAYEAAVAMKCLVTIPDFDTTRALSSFWELAQLAGPNAARELLSSPGAPPDDWDKPKNFYNW